MFSASQAVSQDVSNNVGWSAASRLKYLFNYWMDDHKTSCSPSNAIASVILCICLSPRGLLIMMTLLNLIFIIIKKIKFAPRLNSYPIKINSD